MLVRRAIGTPTNEAAHLIDTRSFTISGGQRSVTRNRQELWIADPV
jgi:hypothetical protein